MARFVAIDVETANAKRASICQIGLVVYDNRKVVDEWSTLVNPEDDFHPINVSIHGIGRKSVASAPTLPEVFAEVRARVAGACIASYGDFDRSAFFQAGQRYGLPALDGQWLDLQHVVKQAWPPVFTANGWALKKICAQLGIDLSNHHDALADARAAGSVFVHAQERTGTWSRDWVGRTDNAVTIADPTPAARAKAPEPNTAGQLIGTRIVFTGELAIPRGAAEAQAAALGCQCSSSVSRKTNILVVGEQDLSLVGNDGLSTKQRKAAALNATGASIRILDGDEFIALLRQHG
jgi:DNA polymerase-3 subunit epsilon